MSGAPEHVLNVAVSRAGVLVQVGVVLCCCDMVSLIAASVVALVRSYIMLAKRSLGRGGVLE